MAGMKAAPECPEHEKLHVVKHESQTVGDFIEWLRGRGVILAEEHDHERSGCTRETEGGGLIPFTSWSCELQQAELLPYRYRLEALLAEYFEIDLNKLEEEKRALLEYQRALNEVNRV